MSPRRFPKFLVCLSLACSGAADAQGQAPAPAPAQPVSVEGDVVTFRGRIDEDSAARFLAIVNAQPVARLVITSHGGLVLPALQMAEAVFTRGIDVEVPQACLSSCANYIFPAARRKFLGRPDAVAWHGNMTHVLHLDQTGQGRWSAELMEGARFLARLEAAFYRRIGVDGFVSWFAKLAPHSVPDFYWLAVDDMARFGIRDVTVADGTPAGRGGADFIRVDWSSLEARRPLVRLDPPTTASPLPPPVLAP